MALQVNFAIQELPDSSGIIFYDTSGDYNASSNPSGWGAPNPAFLTTDYAEITIKDNAGNVIGTADTEFAFTLFDSDRKMTILASDYGLTTFDDQVLEIIYTARDASGGAILSTKDNKVLMFTKTDTAITNALLSQPDFYWVNHPNDMAQLVFYKGLLYSYSYMVLNNIFNAADEGIKLLYEDTLNIHFTA